MEGETRCQTRRTQAIHPAIWHHLLLFIAAVMAGAVNSVAGGGTLLTFPTLIWIGMPAKFANATSTVALWPGSLSSLWAYRAEMGGSRSWLIRFGAVSLVGGLIGARLLLSTRPALFEALVPYLILLASLLFTLQEPVSRWLRRRRASGARGEVDRKDPTDQTDRSDPSNVDLAAAPHVARTATLRSSGHHAPAARVPVRSSPQLAGLAFQLGVAIYGGYFGAGIGILMLAALGLMGMDQIHRMNGIKTFAALCINGIAALTFIAGRAVDWPLALLMAVGAILGGYTGAGTARRLGPKAVRRLIIAIGLAISFVMLVRGR